MANTSDYLRAMQSWKPVTAYISGKMARLELEKRELANERARMENERYPEQADAALEAQQARTGYTQVRTANEPTPEEAAAKRDQDTRDTESAIEARKARTAAMQEALDGAQFAKFQDMEVRATRDVLSAYAEGGIAKAQEVDAQYDEEMGKLVAGSGREKILKERMNEPLTEEHIQLLQQSLRDPELAAKIEALNALTAQRRAKAGSLADGPKPLAPLKATEPDREVADKYISESKILSAVGRTLMRQEVAELANSKFRGLPSGKFRAAVEFLENEAKTDPQSFEARFPNQDKALGPDWFHKKPKWLKEADKQLTHKEAFDRIDG